jgi:hypothetical protein
MPFLELESGEELLLEVDDIPEPPASVFTDNPYEYESIRFKRWRNLAKARYAKAKYRAAVNAQNQEDFIKIIGSAEDLLKDPSSWNSYKVERDMGEYKRPVGRPKLSDAEKVKREPRKKRSDKMRALLLEHGIVVADDGGVVDYVGWLFQPNGRVKFKDDDAISVHAFLKDYV